MEITSTAFQHNGVIPHKYSCDGLNHNPPLTFSEVPAEAQSLALIVEDPDAPSGIFTHWILYNIPPVTLQILENSIPANTVVGKNDYGTEEYAGPCPPSGKHRYFFKLFALNKNLELSKGYTREKLVQAMNDHIIKRAELIGLFRK